MVSGNDVDGDVMFFGDDMHEMSHDVFIMKAEDGDIDLEALKEKYGEDFGELHGAHGEHMVKIIGDADGGHPVIVKSMGPHGGGDFVTYRCEESGSMLVVKADDNLLDDYVDPVSGCLMKKVDQASTRVIQIHKEIKEGL